MCYGPQTQFTVAAATNGVQGHYIVPGFERLGHQVAVFAWWGLMGGITVIDGITTYPMWADPYGCDVGWMHADHFNADVVISLVDLWVCKGYADNLPGRWVPYFPIDSAPVPPDIYELAKRCIVPVNYSNWGVQELKKVGIENAVYIPHGIGDEYRPDPEGGKRWRAQAGIPQDAFLVGGVWANKGFPSRKNFDGQFRAFKKFAEKHKDALLYVHCEPSVRYGGVDCWRLISELGIRNKVIFPNSYLNLLGYEEKWMAGMYNALDVYLSATKGEGWCLPLTEAMACGVPPIATDYSSMPEMLDESGGPGYKVRVAEWELCPLHSYFAMPDTEDIVNGLEVAYRDWRGKKPFPKLAKWAERYYWDTVITDWWGPFLAELERKINVMPWLPGEHAVFSTGGA